LDAFRLNGTWDESIDLLVQPYDFYRTGMCFQNTLQDICAVCCNEKLAIRISIVPKQLSEPTSLRRM